MSCQIKNEICGGKCTSYDGTISKDILIKKNSNAWDARRRIINEGIWCESCRDDANKLETFDHDVVNARIGKTIQDKQNFKKHFDMIKCICNKTGVC